MSDPLKLYELQAPRLLCPWDSPSKNTGVVCHVLLQEIFQTQGSNLHIIMFPALDCWGFILFLFFFVVVAFTTSATWKAPASS